MINQSFIEQLDSAIENCVNEEVKEFLIKERVRLENLAAAESTLDA